MVPLQLRHQEKEKMIKKQINAASVVILVVSSAFYSRTSMAEDLLNLLGKALNAPPPSQAEASNCKTDECQSNGYKDCYCGVKWGEVVDEAVLKKVCPDISYLSTNDLISARSECDKFSTGGLAGLDVTLKYGATAALSPLIMQANESAEDAEKRRHMGDDCKVIVLNDRLVGFYYLQNHTDDEVLYLMKKMKTKYGSAPKKSTCGDEDSASGKNDLLTWSAVNGLNIVFTKMEMDVIVRRNGEKRINEVDRQAVFIRYLNSAAFHQVVSDIKSKAKKAVENSAEKSAEGIGEGI